MLGGHTPHCLRNLLLDLWLLGDHRLLGDQAIPDVPPAHGQAAVQDFLAFFVGFICFILPVSAIFFILAEQPGFPQFRQAGAAITAEILHLLTLLWKLISASHFTSHVPRSLMGGPSDRACE